MENNEDIMHKAEVLMKSALEKYAKGDYDGGDKDRELANKYYDMREAEINSEAELIKLYGENRNFGVIYKVIEENASDILTNKKKTALYKDIVKLLRENDVLKHQFAIYNRFAVLEHIDNSEAFVNEVASLMKHFTKKQIVEANQKLIDKIHSYGLNELVDIDDEQMNLYENIEKLILSKPSFDNSAVRSSAKSQLIEYVEKHKQTVNESVDLDKALNDNINELSEKFEKELNKDEKALVEQVVKTKDKEKLFNDMKSKALKQVNEMMDNADDDAKDAYSNILETIERRKFNTDKLLVDIAEFAEIINLK